MRYTIRKHTVKLHVVSGKEETSEFFVSEGAQATIVVCTGDDTVSDRTLSVHLRGRGATATIVGIVVGRKTKNYTLHTLQHHEAPDTMSNLLIKSALWDDSTLDYKGVIQVDKKAQKTNAYQRNENMLLSENAKANSKPALEILANDVRCTHGATVGMIPKEQLWYLSSRGIGTKLATRLISKGFLTSAFDTVTDEAVHTQTQQFIDTYI